MQLHRGPDVEKASAVNRSEIVNLICFNLYSIVLNNVVLSPGLAEHGTSTCFKTIPHKFVEDFILQNILTLNPRFGI